MHPAAVTEISSRGAGPLLYDGQPFAGLRESGVFDCCARAVRFHWPDQPRVLGGNAVAWRRRPDVEPARNVAVCSRPDTVLVRSSGRHALPP